MHNNLKNNKITRFFENNREKKFLLLLRTAKRLFKNVIFCLQKKERYFVKELVFWNVFAEFIM